MNVFKGLLISIAALMILAVFHQIWFYRKYVRLENISITFLNRTLYPMKIPVKYDPGVYHETDRAIPVSAREYGTFYLKISPCGKMYIHRTALEFGGFALYTANYGICDKKTENELRHFVLQNCGAR